MPAVKLFTAVSGVATKSFSVPAAADFGRGPGGPFSAAVPSGGIASAQRAALWNSRTNCGFRKSAWWPSDV
jgi:hypothetical protein